MTRNSRFWRDYLPLGLWLVVIFLASTDAGSAAHTLGILTRIVHALFGHVVSPPTLDNIDFCVRKTAHITEYAVLGVLVYRVYCTSSDISWQQRVAFLAWLSATIYAGTDEFHQSFVPGRTSCVSDVVIDSCGACLGLLLFKMRHNVGLGTPKPTLEEA